jgi:RNA polymerase sigma-70 factor (ECF subfamily)
MPGDSFEAFVERTRERVFRLVCSIIGPYREADAEEICQEVYLRACRGMERFRGEAELSTWLFRIAWNTALSHRNVSPVRKGTIPIEDLLDFAAPHDTEKIAIDRERSRTLIVAIESLPHPYRTAIYMHYWMGATVEEIAEVLGVASGTIKSYLSRARERLRRELADGGWEVSP